MVKNIIYLIYLLTLVVNAQEAKQIFFKSEEDRYISYIMYDDEIGSKIFFSRDGVRFYEMFPLGFSGRAYPLNHKLNFEDPFAITSYSQTITCIDGRLLYNDDYFDKVAAVDKIQIIPIPDTQIPSHLYKAADGTMIYISRSKWTAYSRIYFGNSEVLKEAEIVSWIGSKCNCDALITTDQGFQLEITETKVMLGEKEMAILNINDYSITQNDAETFVVVKPL